MNLLNIHRTHNGSHFLSDRVATFFPGASFVEVTDCSRFSDYMKRCRELDELWRRNVDHPNPTNSQAIPDLRREPRREGQDYDFVESPSHYHWHPYITAADLARPFPYDVGTCMAYLYRAGRKPQHEEKSGVEQEVQDIRKAIRHLQFHINGLEGRKSNDPYPY